MARRGAAGKRGKANATSFKPGSNSVHGGIVPLPPRGPDRVPRKQIIATLQQVALNEPQWRDPRTGKIANSRRSKRANLVRAAGMRDLNASPRAAALRLGARR